MRELSLHLLDIAENSISAGASRIEIVLSEDSALDLLQMSIIDNGKGMSKEMIAQVTDPFITSRTTRKVGLGIPLLKAAAEDCNGSLNITSEPGIGTELTVKFQRSHIDRMPIGDLVSTIVNLIICNPLIHWIFSYQYNEKSAIFDDEPVKQTIGDIPLTEPEILTCIRSMIEETIQEVNPLFSQDIVTIYNQPLRR
ncbi:MAG TPA: ATP-binding protein [Anaerolineaceae bacterium]|nr:ATP-binding protein [Anaerolineaceae bacterium]